MNYNNYDQRGGSSTNSTLMTSFSDACRFSVKAWDKQLSVQFAPCTGVNNDGLRIYETDQARCINTALRYENAISLLQQYEKTLKPAIEAGEAKTISVDIRGKDGVLKVLTIGSDGENRFIRVAWNVGDDGVGSAENSIVHTFNKREVREDYNLLTGESIKVPVDAEFLHFINELESVKLFGPEVNHGIRHDNAMRAAFANNRYAGKNAAYGGQGNYNGQQPGAYGNYGNGGNAFMQPGVGDGSDFLPFQ